ncbi:DUF3802 family protein [Idiomarina xiamenensis]|uniref:Topoisomerase II n=1 Tax=Idiomarina xiamenensis 10-D-4 TaxID=740709 RepID=K2KCV4_9GAMM|nr:DUF3802 family protein [Idiomarina xiamenensis]EKE84522.1 hypothetical protein A10D4_05622 [Idiomarina xiamenensis 10-D-4]
MIVESDGYIELIQYLTGQLSVFATGANTVASEQADYTLRELFEERLASNIMAVCQQHQLDQSQRLDIIRETDAVLYDLEEVLSSVLNNHPTPEQEAFAEEFIGLVKNLFDTRINAG